MERPASYGSAWLASFSPWTLAYAVYPRTDGRTHARAQALTCGEASRAGRAGSRRVKEVGVADLIDQARALALAFSHAHVCELRK